MNCDLSLDIHRITLAFRIALQPHAYPHVCFYSRFLWTFIPVVSRSKDLEQDNALNVLPVNQYFVQAPPRPSISHGHLARHSGPLRLGTFILYLRKFRHSVNSTQLVS